MKRGLTAIALTIGLTMTSTSCGSASHTKVFSVEQLLRAFVRQGIPLHRSVAPTQGDPAPAQGPDVQEFARTMNGGGIWAVVIKPGTHPPESPPVFGNGAWKSGMAQRGNVRVYWLGTQDDARTIRALHAALRSLRYSAVEAASPLLPDVVLSPGQTRTVDTGKLPPGTAVECISGSGDAQELAASESAIPAVEFTASKEVRLQWRRLSGSRRAYSCTAKHAVPPSDIFPHSGTPEFTFGMPLGCHAGPRTVRTAGVVAQVPAGWFASKSTNAKMLWLSNRRDCGAESRLAADGIYVMVGSIRIAGPAAPGKWQFQPHDAGKKLFRRFGFYEGVLVTPHVAYYAAIMLGKAVRNAAGIRLAKSVIEGIRPAAAGAAQL